MSKPIELGVIVRGYEGWKAACYSEPLHPSQETELRRAFFSGALHLFHSLMTVFDEGSEEPTARDESQMETIHAELEAFGMAVAEGEA